MKLKVDWLKSIIFAQVFREELTTVPDCIEAYNDMLPADEKIGIGTELERQYWSKKITEAALMRGEISTVDEAINYFNEIKNSAKQNKKDLAIPKKKIPENQLSITDRYDINFDEIKEAIIQAILEIEELEGKPPNAHCICNEIDHPRVIVKEVLEELVIQGIIKKLNVGKGHLYTSNTISGGDPAAERKNSVMDATQADLERLLEDFNNLGTIIEEDPKMANPRKMGAERIAHAMVTKGKNNQALENVKRLCERLELSRGEVMSLISKYSGKLEELEIVLAQRYIEEKGNK